MHASDMSVAPLGKTGEKTILFESPKKAGETSQLECDPSVPGMENSKRNHGTYMHQCGDPSRGTRQSLERVPIDQRYSHIESDRSAPII